MTKVNLVGQRFNSLLALERVIKNNHACYICKCDCDNITKPIPGYRLKSGSTKKCFKCSTKTNVKMRKEYGESARNSLIRRYKENAKNHNREFLLTQEEMIIFFQSNCYYCGRKPYSEIKGNKAFGSYTYNGIDRKNNDVGYIKENCVSCCKECNYKKHTQNIDDFFKWILDVYEHITKQGYVHTLQNSFI